MSRTTSKYSKNYIWSSLHTKYIILLLNWATDGKNLTIIEYYFISFFPRYNLRRGIIFLVDNMTKNKEGIMRVQAFTKGDS